MASEHTKNPSADGAARSDATKAPLQQVPVTGDAPGPITGDDPADEAFMHRIAPSRQRNARAFLQGKSPGVMQRYAPDATTSSTEGFVEDDDTVHRLARWREEAIQ